MRALLVVAALGSLAAAVPAHAQILTGILLEQDTDRPVARATIELLDGDSRRARAVTDAEGKFAFHPPQHGTYRLRASRLGYAPTVSRDVEVGVLDSVYVVFKVAANTVELEPLQVTAVPRRVAPWLTGFYRRVEEGGFGRYVTRQQIALSNPFHASDALRNVPGVRVVSGRQGAGNHIRLRGNCTPTFFLDGLHLEMLGASIDQFVNPVDIEGIEVYNGPSNIPAEFMREGRGGCGAVVIWTRLDQ